MSDEKRRLEYFAFAVEVFKSEKGLTGQQAYKILRESEADTYIYSLYELLHVHGTKYLMAELDEYLARRDAYMESSPRTCEADDRKVPSLSSIINGRSNNIKTT